VANEPERDGTVLESASPEKGERGKNAASWRNRSISTPHLDHLSFKSKVARPRGEGERLVRGPRAEESWGDRDPLIRYSGLPD